jgi:hypothetical protein
MPVVVTETDTFSATLQRPSNGELADSASIQLPVEPLAKRTRWLYNRGRSALYDVTRAPFSADPTGVASSQAAFVAAIAAAAATYGDVYVPPGVFLHTGLSVPYGVSIYFAPGAYLSINDATANTLVFTGSNDGPPSVISGGHFIGNVANTGTCVVNNSDAHVIFERCSWNGFTSGGAPSSNLQGKLASTNSASSELLFVDCLLKVAGDINGLDVLQGKIGVVRGKLTMPATYNQTLFRVEGTSTGTMSNVNVDCTARAAGGGVAVMLIDAGATGTQVGCVIDGTAASGTIYDSLWSAGARIQTDNNILLGNIVHYIGNLPAPGSVVSGRLPATSVSSGPAVTIPDGVSTFVYKGTGTVPAFTLPASPEKYSRLRLVIYNGSGGNWAAFSIGVSIVPVPALTNGGTSCCELQYIDLFTPGTFAWVMLSQQGTP